MILFLQYLLIGHSVFGLSLFCCLQQDSFLRHTHKKQFIHASATTMSQRNCSRHSSAMSTCRRGLNRRKITKQKFEIPSTIRRMDKVHTIMHPRAQLIRLVTTPTSHTSMTNSFQALQGIQMLIIAFIVRSRPFSEQSPFCIAGWRAPIHHPPLCRVHHLTVQRWNNLGEFYHCKHLNETSKMIHFHICHSFHRSCEYFLFASDHLRRSQFHNRHLSYNHGLIQCCPLVIK